MTEPRPPKIAKDKTSTVADLPLACSSEDAAVAFLEEKRWGGKPVCPHCGVVGEAKQILGKTGQRGPRYLWRCLACKKQFTVRIGTVFGESRIPLRHWCYAFWAACASKKGVSALQIKRQTGLSYKSALFLMHRIRLAMTPDDDGPKLTGTIEADETFVGGKARHRSKAEREKLKAEGHTRVPRAMDNKTPVLALLDREDGNVRATVIADVTAKNVRAVLEDNVDPSARLMTDEGRQYIGVGKEFADHQTVQHSAYEYARGEAHINGAESFFSRLKRQLYGTHHAVSKKHLHRYVAEVEFKHNTRKMDDGERTVTAIRNGMGKRLRYKPPTAA